MSESETEGPCAAERKEQLGPKSPLDTHSQSGHYIEGIAAHTTKGEGTIESLKSQSSADVPVEKREEPGCDGVEITLDQARLTARIKGLYNELLQTPIPEEWVRLVKALETKERK